jgi:hypothetical protein
MLLGFAWLFNQVAQSSGVIVIDWVRSKLSTIGVYPEISLARLVSYWLMRGV